MCRVSRVRIVLFTNKLMDKSSTKTDRASQCFQQTEIQCKKKQLTLWLDLETSHMDFSRQCNLKTNWPAINHKRHLELGKEQWLIKLPKLMYLCTCTSIGAPSRSSFLPLSFHSFILVLYLHNFKLNICPYKLLYENLNLHFIVFILGQYVTFQTILCNLKLFLFFLGYLLVRFYSETTYFLATILLITN